MPDHRNPTLTDPHHTKKARVFASLFADRRRSVELSFKRGHPRDLVTNRNGDHEHPATEPATPQTRALTLPPTFFFALPDFFAIGADLLTWISSSSESDAATGSSDPLDAATSGAAAPDAVAVGSA